MLSHSKHVKNEYIKQVETAHVSVRSDILQTKRLMCQKIEVHEANVKGEMMEQRLWNLQKIIRQMGSATTS